MTEEIESGRSVTEEERENPVHAPGTGVPEEDQSPEPAPRPNEQERPTHEEDTAHRIGSADSGQNDD